ncbi:MAG: glycosyltransferase family 39 protein [Deltaproteobacteria bacterium]|nr:glycosyltransferase family 39 protein [Deltaproteobacteria bacterium]
MISDREAFQRPASAFRTRPILVHTVLIVAMALLLAAAWRNQMQNVSAVLIGQEGLNPINLPHREPIRDSTPTKVKGSFRLGALASSTMRVIADDCLLSFELNGEIVSLPVEANPCDPHIGLDFDVSGLLKDGENTFEARYFNRTGPTSFYVSISPRKWLTNTCYVLLAALFVGWIVYSGRLLALAAREITLIIFATILKLAYWSYTPFHIRTHDLFYTGHLDYIHHMANHWYPPDPDTGWEYHQMPLYYYVAALAYKISLLTWKAGSYEMLQAMSLLISTGFLLFMFAAAATILKDNVARFTACALMAALPSAIMDSVRVGNDILLWMLSAAALYYLVAYSERNNARHLIFASLCTALAMLTKASALPLAAVVLLSIILSYKSARKAALYSAAILTTGSSFFLLRSADNFISSKRDLLLHPEYFMGVMHAVEVDNTPSNFLYFDLVTFLQTPFISVVSDITGRQFVPNVLLRTFISGEYFLPGAAAHWAGIALGAALLTVLILFVFGMRDLLKKNRVQALYMILFLILSLSALLTLRYRVPTSTAADARFIMPALFTIFIFVGGLAGKASMPIPIKSSLVFTVAVWVAAGSVMIIGPAFRL